MRIKSEVIVGGNDSGGNGHCGSRQDGSMDCQCDDVGDGSQQRCLRQSQRHADQIATWAAIAKTSAIISGSGDGCSLCCLHCDDGGDRAPSIVEAGGSSSPEQTNDNKKKSTNF